MNEYTQLATEFDQWANSGRGASMAQGHWDVTMQMLDSSNTSFDGNCLDVGCGNGWLVREMLRRGAQQGLGVDISPQMVAVANQSRQYETEQYVVSNGESLPFEEGSIQVITNIESLYYYPDPQAAIHEWFRIVTSGGRLLMMMDLYAENTATHTWIEALQVPVHLFSKDQLREMLESAGWIIETMHQYQDRRPLKTSEDFVVSPYWPSYEQYLAYRETGSLCIVARKR